MKIGHIAIWCRNLGRLRDFYATYFDAEPGDRYRNDAKGSESVFLGFESGPRLELMQAQSIPFTANDPYEQFTGLIHLAISVGSEARVDELTERLAQAGHAVLDGPRRTGDGYYRSVVRDPENNRTENTA